MRRRALLGILVLLATLVLAGPIRAETRIALVIGNGAYPSDPLASPKHDAEAVARKLRELGFAVTKEVDLGGAALRKVIRAFGERLERPGTVGLFYYSGHGMQVNNRNYMIPLDAEIRDEADVEEAGVPMESVLRRMEQARSNPNIIILDACRSNPIQKTLKSAQAGLAQMRPPTSTLIAFAAAPGQYAWAASGGRLSPYTEALIEHIATPGQDLIKMFQTVQNAVWRLTQGRQHPHVEFTPGLPEFSFVPVDAVLPLAPPAEPPQKKPPAPSVAPGGGNSFKDCEVCPEMVKILKGRFLMGSDAGDRDETPVHEVRVSQDFYMSRHEISFAEWDACVAARGCSHTPDDRGWGRGDLPVINVNWRDADEYVRWLSALTGKNYRLPSEAQWEYAAKNGGNQDVRGASPITARPLGVGSTGENAFGLTEMLGNVAEWVADCQTENYRRAPADARVQEGGSCARRGVRGGSWYQSGAGMRSADRGFEAIITRVSYIGFRVIKEEP